MALIIFPGRYNVIAKERIKNGVGIGMKGWWEETTPDIIRRNNSTVASLTDPEIQDYIDRYDMKFVVTWADNPNLITLHPANDSRLQFIPQEE